MSSGQVLNNFKDQINTDLSALEKDVAALNDIEKKAEVILSFSQTCVCSLHHLLLGVFFCACMSSLDFVVQYYFSHSIHCAVNFVSNKSSFASCKTVTYFEHFKAVMLIYEKQQCACVYGSLQGSQNKCLT